MNKDLKAKLTQSLVKYKYVDQKQIMSQDVKLGQSVKNMNMKLDDDKDSELSGSVLLFYSESSESLFLVPTRPPQ